MSAFILDRISTGPSSVEQDDEKMIGVNEGEWKEEAASVNEVDDAPEVMTKLNRNAQVVGVDGTVEMHEGDVEELDGDVRETDNSVDLDIYLASQ